MDIRLSILVSPPPLVSPLPEPQLASPLVPQATAMPPPPEAIYSSRDELYSLIQAWATQHQYAFIVGRSNKIHKSPRIKVFYNCDRYGPIPSKKPPAELPAGP